MNLIRSLSQHWIGISMLAYLFALIIQQYLILPLELSLTNENAALASFLFLPHAVRVLSAWLLGPKSLLAIYGSSRYWTLLDKRYGSARGV